ncbi:MAG: hypothetical protein WCO65_01150 [bacterium]
MQKKIVAWGLLACVVFDIAKVVFFPKVWIITTIPLNNAWRSIHLMFGLLIDFFVIYAIVLLFKKDKKD